MYEPIRTGEIPNDQSPKALQVIEGIAKYLHSIKQNVIRLIKKTNLKELDGVELSKSNESCFGEEDSMKNIFTQNQRKEDASTKMTEDDRILGNNLFVSDGTKSKMKRNREKDICIFDLATDNLELPTVRPRSSSFHLGKRRFASLCNPDQNCEKMMKVGEFSCFPPEGGVEGQGGVGSSFFMMTNQFYKNRDKLLRINL